MHRVQRAAPRRARRPTNSTDRHDLGDELLEERLVSHRAPPGSGGRGSMAVVRSRAGGFGSSSGPSDATCTMYGSGLGSSAAGWSGSVKAVYTSCTASTSPPSSSLKRHDAEVAAEQDLAGVAQVAEGVLVAGGDRLVGVDRPSSRRRGRGRSCRRRSPSAWIGSGRSASSRWSSSGVARHRQSGGAAGLSRLALVRRTRSVGRRHLGVVVRPAPRRAAAPASPRAAPASSGRGRRASRPPAAAPCRPSGCSQPMRSVPRLARTICWANAAARSTAVIIVGITFLNPLDVNCTKRAGRVGRALPVAHRRRRRVVHVARQQHHPLVRLEPSRAAARTSGASIAHVSMASGLVPNI